MSVQVTGHGGVPSTGVAAVVVNVTVASPTASGYVTVFPQGATRPVTSNLNFAAHQTVPNLVVVPVSTSGRISLYNGSSGTVRLVGDVAGYYRAGTATAAGTFTAVGPARVLDTGAGTGAPKAPVAARTTLSVQVTGHGGVPSTGVAAVVVNVTVASPTASGYVTVFPQGATRPVTSNLNFAAHQTVPNLVVVPVSTSGRISLYNGSSGTVRLVGDVAGYYRAGTATAAGTFTAVGPARVLDTGAGTGAPKAPVAARTTLSVQVTGHGGVPSTGVAAVVVNVTVASPTASGYVTVFPQGATRPVTSNLNFAAHQTVPNLVVVPVSTSGRISLYNGSSGTVRLVGDVAGYYRAGTSDTTPPGPVTGLSATSSTTSVALSWTNPTDADFAGVMIRRAPGTTAPTSPTAGTLVTDTSGTTHTYTDTGLTPATTYSYTLFAHDNIPNYATPTTKTTTTSTPADTTPPGPVTGLSATPSTTTTITLSWTNPTDADFAGVMIRRAPGTTPPTSPSAGTLVTDSSGPTHTFTDTGLTPATTYSYTLFAHDAVPNYATPTTTAATTSAAAPPEPVAGLKASTTATTVNLAWTNPTDSDFTGVIIRRAAGATAPSSPSSGTAVVDVAAPTHTYADQNLITGTTYSYALFAHDSAGHYAAGVDVTAAATCQHVDLLHVSKNVTTDTTWSPMCADTYVLDTTIVVGASATLTMASGVTVDARTGGLEVRGRMTAEGSAGSLVSLNTSSVQPWPFEVKASGAIDMSWTAITNADITADPSLVSGVAGGSLSVEHAVITDTAFVTPDSFEVQQQVTDWPGFVIDDSTLSDGDLLSSNQGPVNWRADHDQFSDFTLTAGGVTAGVPSDTTFALTNDTFDHSPANIAGGSPVIQADTWTDSAAGGTTGAVNLYLAADLSGVHGNTFTGGGLNQVATFDGQVTHPWTIDGATSGQVTAFGTVTVDNGGTIAATVGAQVKVYQLEVQPGGTVTMTGTSSDPIIVTSICDDTVGANTGAVNGSGYIVCQQDSISGSGTITADPSLTAGVDGGKVTLTDATVTDTTLTESSEYYTQSQVTSWPAYDITDSSLSDGAVAPDIPQIVNLSADSDEFSSFPVTVAQDSTTSAAITNDTFVGSPVGVTGGSPVIQADTWTDSAAGGTTGAVNLYLAADLSGVHGNTFTGGGLNQVATFDGQVTHPWTIDGATSGQVTAFGTVTVDNGGTIAATVGAEIKVYQLEVQPGGTVTMTGTSSDPIIVTSICDDTVGANTGAVNGSGYIVCQQDSISGSGTITADPSLTAGVDGGKVTLTDATVTDTTFSTLDSYEVQQQVTDWPGFLIDDSTLSDGHLYLKISVANAGSTVNDGSAELTNDSFKDCPVDITGGSPEIKSDTWNDTDYPFTASGAEDLSGIADDNTASGANDPDDVTFELEGSVATGKTLTLAPATKVLYVSDGIAVEDGATITNDVGAVVSGGGITIDDGGTGGIEPSAWAGGEPTFDVEAGGTLDVYGATITGADLAINAHCDNGSDSEEPAQADVTVSGTTFSNDADAIEYCDTEYPTDHPKLQATGNSGLSVDNVTTHEDECGYEPPAALVAEAAVGDLEAAAEIEALEEANPPYELGPIWDVYIGQPDPTCQPPYNPESGGYVKEVR